MKDTNLILIQQRSPCLPHLIEKYSQEYLQFLKSFNFLYLFFLCSSTTQGINDEILQSQRFFCYQSSQIPEQIFPQFQSVLNHFQVNIFDWPSSNLKKLNSTSLLIGRRFEVDNASSIYNTRSGAVSFFAWYMKGNNHESFY